MPDTPLFTLDLPLLRTVVSSRRHVFSTLDIACDIRMSEHYGTPTVDPYYNYLGTVNHWLYENQEVLGILYAGHCHCLNGVRWVRLHRD